MCGTRERLPPVAGRRDVLVGAVATAVWLAGCRSGGDATPVASPSPSPAGGDALPVRAIRYGAHHAQFAELTVPAGPGPWPVAVVIHGGFWRSQYDLSLGRPLAETLPPNGWAALNVEYRRIGDGGGYPATLDDVRAAIDALADVDAPLDLAHVVTIGHSAGGHLAAWAATRDDPVVAVTAVIPQAGVLDLRQAAADGLGGGAAQALLGGEPTVVDDRYTVASPIDRLPLSVPIRAVHGRADPIVPLGQSEAFVEAALAAGDDAELAVVDGDHFVVIDPAGEAWATVLRWLDELP